MTVMATEMTAKEFSAWIVRPENIDSHWELDRGVIVEFPLPKPLHGFICVNSARLLSYFAHTRERGYVCTNNFGMLVKRDPDTLRGPDVVYFVDDALMGESSEGWPETPPIIAVEVLSPDDRVNQVALKVDEYLAFGVKQVWVVDPEAKDIAVHRAGVSMRLLSQDDELSGGDDLPGFSCRVSDFFRLPGQKVT